MLGVAVAGLPSISWTRDRFAQRFEVADEVRELPTEGQAGEPLRVEGGCRLVPVVERAEDGFRGIVGGVRVPQMRPEEERLLLLGAQAPQQPGGRLVGGFRRLEVLVDDVEAPAHAPVAPGELVGDHGARRVARLAQDLRQRALALAQGDAPQEPVGVRVLSGVDRGQRGDRARRLADAAGEDARPPPEGIDLRTHVPPVAVDAEMVRPQRVERDEDYVAALAAMRAQRRQHSEPCGREVGAGGHRSEQRQEPEAARSYGTGDPHGQPGSHGLASRASRPWPRPPPPACTWRFPPGPSRRRPRFQRPSGRARASPPRRCSPA